jgi:Spy/CpxP family protein refolding chaperone
MKTAISLSLLVAACITTLALPVFAQDSPVPAPDLSTNVDEAAVPSPAEPCPPGDCVMGPGMACQPPSLNLTDEQYEKIFALKRENMSKLGGKFSEVATQEMTLHDLLLQPTIDTAKVQGIQQRINALKAEMANARLQEEIGMMNVLTPEQRHQLRMCLLKHAAGPLCCGGGGGFGHGGKTFIRRHERHQGHGKP